MLALTFALALNLAAPADIAAPAAQVAAPPSMKGAHLGWRREPDPFLINKYFPDAAKTAGVSKAKVQVACTVQGKTGLLKCVAFSESVPNLGFGDAAVKVTQKGLVMSMDEKSPEGRTFLHVIKFGTWNPGEN